MKYIFTLIAAALLFAVPKASASPGVLPPIQIRVVCTVATPWDPQACWVEFDEPAYGMRVETASYLEAEELIAILLEYSGRRYEFDVDVPPMSLPLPATLQLKRPPLTGSQVEP